MSSKTRMVLVKNERLARSAASRLSLLYLPDFDAMPFSENSPEVRARRVEVLFSLMRGKAEGIVCTLSAISRYLPSPKELLDSALKIVEGKDLRIDPAVFSRMGYTRVDTVREVGEFAIRGDILDVFPPLRKRPVRIELFDDVVEEIREFDPMSQRSIGILKEVEIPPASENLSGDPSLDTLPIERGDSSTIFDYSDFEVFSPSLEEVVEAHSKKLKELRELSPEGWERYSRSIMSIEEVLKKLGRVRKIEMETGRVEEPERIEGVPVLDAEDLSVGDLVVHKDYGIGRFAGLEKVKSALGEKDYVKLEYADSTLYVPVERISKLHKYIGPSRELDSLKSKKWRSRLRRIKRDIERRVKELVRLYAARSSVKGLSLVGDPELEEKFAQTFPHIETPDQLKAIEETLEDLASEKPMDRLISGDSGFGKTEVALRAAFRAVVSGKQVAVLAPTVILANQHYRTFKERMEDFGVVVELLDSTKRGKEKRKILERLKKGEIDVIVGTHAILSDEVKFSDLGLVIIDEEQKFGVEQKEKLKKLRLSVNVLSMSATPIPRTLHMALSGMKDISVLRTPPLGRKPVSVYVGPYSDSIVRAAVFRELARGGQVIYVHNRVEEIPKVLERLKEILPDVSIAVAHGRMDKRKLEAAVESFESGEADLLLCTTVIESGIDIGTANTIIVDDAHRYGLSQLYQLRGRVGRRTVRGFAYFLHPPGTSKKAVERLKVIKELTGAGSGLEIALRDMEMRGYGDVLGLEQSGHIESIGYKYYVEIVKETLGKFRGEVVEEPDVEIVGYPGDVHIPEEYVPDPMERLRLYRRISSATSFSEIDEIEEEMRDRFGRLPQAAYNLLELAKFRLALARIGAEKVEIGKGSLRLSGKFEPGIFGSLKHAFVGKGVIVMEDFEEFKEWLFRLSRV